MGLNYTDEEMQMLYDRRNDKTEHPDRPWVITDSNGKYRYLGNFDWYDYMFKRSRPETERNNSLTGGNDKINYYVSGRYLYREGLFNHGAEDIYNGYSFRTKIAAEVTPWMHYSNNISMEVTDYKYGGYWEQDGSEELNSNGILFNVANNISPTFVPVNPDGTTFVYSNGIQFANSPIASGRGGVFADGRNKNSRKNNYYIITNRVTFDLTRNKDLKLNADYTYRRRDNLGAYRSYPTANTWNATQTAVVDFTNGSIYDFYQEDRYYYNGHVVNAYLDYGHSWGKHNFSAVAGGNFEDFRSSKLSVRQKGSLSEKLSFINMAQGEIERCVESNTAYRTLGYFARANYDYAGKYLFEVSARYDGSSRFAANDRWGFFPSASAGWRISEEKFWEPMRNWWDNAKVRFSYGSLGNQQVSNYYYIETISTGQLGTGQLRLGVEPHQRRTYVGDGRNLHPRFRSGLPQKPPQRHGRPLHPRHQGHAHHVAHAARRLRSALAQGELRRPAPQGLRNHRQLARPPHGGRQTLLLRHFGIAGRLQVQDHQV